MANFPGANVIRDAAVIESAQKDNFENWLAATKQLVGGAAQTTLTLNNDQITPTCGMHLVATQGAAGTDNLAQILPSNLPDGSFLVLGIESNARVVVLKHAAGGTGQLSLVNGVDWTMSDTTSFIVLQRKASVWEERGRWYGAAAAAHRSFYGTPGLGQNRFTGRQELNRGSNLVAAATLPLATDGNWFWVSGTTGISALSAAPLGTRVILGFESAVVLVHSSALRLVGAANRLTRAGEQVEFVCVNTGEWWEVGGGLSAPTVIVGSVLYAAVGPTSVETFAGSVSIPGGTFSTYRSLRVTVYGYFTGALDPVLVQALFRLYYGGALIAGMNVIIGSPSYALPIGTAYKLSAHIQANGGAYGQLGHMHCECAVKYPVTAGANTPYVVGSGWYNAGYPPPGRTTTAIDSTVNQTLQLNIQIPGTGVNAVCATEWWEVERIP